ncbi:hypothetical protein PoHVEF18_000969 [Penicillium ochrochloron]
MFRTFHPALRSEPEVFNLTCKTTNNQVWLVFPQKGDSGPFAHVGGRAVHTQPYFETPTEHGMKYAMTREDPIQRVIDVNEAFLIYWAKIVNMERSTHSNRPFNALG